MVEEEERAQIQAEARLAAEKQIEEKESKAVIAEEAEEAVQDARLAEGKSVEIAQISVELGAEDVGLANEQEEKEAAEGESSHAVVYISRDTSQSPTGRGEGEKLKSRGESAFAGFFNILSSGRLLPDVIFKQNPLFHTNGQTPSM